MSGHDTKDLLNLLHGPRRLQPEQTRRMVQRKFE
jgi:hypothetical protein